MKIVKNNTVKYLLFISFLLVFIVLLSKTNVQASTCTHSWVPVLEETGTVSAHTTSGTEYLSTEPYKCRCGAYFFNIDDVYAHQNENESKGTCWSWSSGSSGIFPVPGNTYVSMSSTKYNVVAYRCEKCGELR